MADQTDMGAAAVAYMERVMGQAREDHILSSFPPEMGVSRG